MDHNDLIPRFELSVRKTLENLPLTRGGRLIVAVSGGPDSLAMLYALHHLCARFELNLHGAHLDHGIRGSHSRADAQFVKNTFDLLKIPSTIEFSDVPQFQADHKLSPEESARKARYHFLTRVAHEHQAQAISVGHTSDDQAETVLMHMIRGAGVTGLTGMTSLTKHKSGGLGICLLRPLINLSRKDTIAYCQALNLTPRVDETNALPIYSRNKIRLQLVPTLEQFNPKAKEALVRLSSNSMQIREYLDKVVEEHWDDVVMQQSNQVFVKIEELRNLPPAIQTHLLRRAIEVKKGTLNEIQQGHVDAMIRLAVGPAGRTLDLPGNLRFMAGYHLLAIVDSKYDREPCPLPPFEGIHRLSVPGSTKIGAWEIKVRILERTVAPNLAVQNKSWNVNNLTTNASHEFTRFTPKNTESFSTLLSYNSIGTNLYVRRREPSDNFHPLGMSGSKSLQNFMVDSKIPRWWRKNIPLVTANSSIAWVVGWRIAEWAKIQKSDKQLIEIEFTT